MDCSRMSLKVIKEGIEKRNYKINGILETGELVIAILSNLEIKVLNDVKKYEDLEKFINLKGRPANEILQTYKQKLCNKSERCIKNNLRIR